MESPNLLPAEYTSRQAVFGDIPAVVELLNAYSRQLMGSNKLEAADLETEWKMEGYRPETHIRLVFDAQPRLVGYMEFWDNRYPQVTMFSWGRVDPACRRTDTMRYLLDWAEQRARQNLAHISPELRVALHSNTPAQDEYLRQQLEAAGFSMVRRYWRMVIDLPEQPARPVLPEGITLRSVQPGEERRAFWALNEAFKDHWGHIERPFEEEFARWEYFARNDPLYDPSLRFLALDGDEIAGFSYCRRSISDDPGMGWVGQLGVLRPWRKRGLGLALLQHSFCALYERGQRRVGLGVDSSSLTGATRLYEKAGMHSDPLQMNDLYEKELRPGIDLATQAVESQAQAGQAD